MNNIIVNISNTDNIIDRLMCVLMYCQYRKTLLKTDRNIESSI